MSIGTADYEEWAVAELHDLAGKAEDYVQGRISRSELASAIGRARSFLAAEERFQYDENGYLAGVGA